jgi:hypothetical protein
VFWSPWRAVRSYCSAARDAISARGWTSGTPLACAATCTSQARCSM